MQYDRSCYERMEEMINSYYRNNAEKLHKVVDKILNKFGRLYDKDIEDFYSLANEVFVDAIHRFDQSQSFDGFLYVCLSNKIKTEITRRNREKRKGDSYLISIDMPLENSGNITLKEIIVSDFDLEKEVFGENDRNNVKIEAYLMRLSKVQREIVELLAACYKSREIQKILHITPQEYSNHMEAIRAYDNICVLF